MVQDNKEDNCFYDYENRCDCAEDDKCGCSYPNNLGHDFTCNEITIKSNFKTIKTEHNEIQDDSVCICSPQECSCKIEHREQDI